MPILFLVLIEPSLGLFWYFFVIYGLYFRQPLIVQLLLYSWFGIREGHMVFSNFKVLMQNLPT